MDYKSGGKKLDAMLVEHGVQLQLLAYLNVLRHWKNPREKFGADRLIPAGFFMSICAASLKAAERATKFWTRMARENWRIATTGGSTRARWTSWIAPGGARPIQLSLTDAGNLRKVHRGAAARGI